MLVDYFSSRFQKDHLQYDEPTTNEFNPLRKNLVSRFDGDNLKIFNEIKASEENFQFIDSTFEIQFRTTLSEGWHEVDHNMRYKCQQEWEHLRSESRTLNGIYATLETSDHSLKHLFDDIAYHHYKSKDWNGMLRNKFRLRFKLSPLHQDILKILDSKPKLAKELFRIDRIDVLEAIVNSHIRISITFDNIVFLCNHLFLHDSDIEKLVPEILTDDFKYFFSN